MTSLRRELETIVGEGGAFLLDHPQAIRRLRFTHPHSIQRANVPHVHPFNCFTYALGVVDSEVVYSLLYEDRNRLVPIGTKVGTDFVKRIIERRILVEDVEGKVLVYFRDEHPVHAGRLEGGKVVSKWGVGYLWRHGEWEVPASYGCKTVRYRSATVSAIEEEFVRYAASLGRAGYP